MSEWTMQEAAEVVMAGRKAARRSGLKFVIDRARMQMAGFIDAEIDEIHQAVDAVERFKDETFSALRRRI